VERLAYDRADADVASLRALAIGTVVIGAALLAGLAQAWWAYAVALGSLVAVRFWARQVSGARARAPQLEGRALVLSDEGVEIPRAAGETSRVRWTELERVEIDHDRLLVVLRTRDAEIEVEPCFGGLGLDELARRLDARRP
jgi:hypothetical protein